jgi:homoserine O-acetyltransferase
MSSLSPARERSGSVGSVQTQFFTFGDRDDPLALRSGETLDEVTVAYETYGALSEDRDNAVLVFHALTGSQHAAGINQAVPAAGSRWTEECVLGWWDPFIGPGKAIDTDRFFVVCANLLGSCYGSTGPTSTDPATGRRYGASFPSVAFCDMVDVQVRLLEHLGIDRLHAVIGGSIGGVMCLSLATRYPDLVDNVIPIAAGLRTTALQKIHNFEQIVAIESDPAFGGGDYPQGNGPVDGLALARMIGHKTFVSLGAMEERARHEVIDHVGPGSYSVDTPLESYMWHQGRKFVERFDANSYLRIIEAWQTFDLVSEAGVRGFDELFAGSSHQFYMVFSIDTDVCFYPDQQDDLVQAIKAGDAPHRRITVHSRNGHDAFLIEPDLFAPHLTATLTNAG